MRGWNFEGGKSNVNFVVKLMQKSSATGLFLNKTFEFDNAL